MAAGKFGSKGYTSASRGSDFLRSVLQNGSGRYVQQLQRLTFRFCQKSQESKQTRDYVENGLTDFANRNPGVVLYVTPESDVDPKICAEYLNGRTEIVTLNKLTEDEISKKCEDLKDRSGLEIMRRRKNIHTDVPSIQGEWTPFTNFKKYDVKYKPNFAVETKHSWDSFPAPWTGLYRRNELYKLENRQKLNYTEKSQEPLGKWGPILRPKY
ncbi:large ribosomal subunit protein mL43-like [Styela clava]